MDATSVFMGAVFGSSHNHSFLINSLATCNVCRQQHVARFFSSLSQYACFIIGINHCFRAIHDPVRTTFLVTAHGSRATGLQQCMRRWAMHSFRCSSHKEHKGTKRWRIPHPPRTSLSTVGLCIQLWKPAALIAALHASDRAAGKERAESWCVIIHCQHHS